MRLSNPAALKLFLDRVLSRSRLGDDAQLAILDLPGSPSQVPANVDFVRLGSQVDHACLIVEGLAGRFAQTCDGNRQITALHIAGDMADLHSVVAPEVTSALQALAPTTVLRVPHSALRAVAGRYPEIAEALWRDMVVDAAIAYQWIANIGRRDARARTAHLLCEMARRYEQIGIQSASGFNFPATQVHLADALGLTPVHVNRCLASFRNDGIVRLSSRRVEILNWQALVQAGDFDDGYLQIRDEARAPERRLQLV